MTLEEAKRVNRYNLFVAKYTSTVTSLLRIYPEQKDTKNFGFWLLENGFFSAPASTKYHGAYEGGLFDHSLRVAQRLLWLTKKLNLEWKYPDSPIVVGLLHDLCKVDRYKKSPDNSEQPYVYNDKLMYEGHGMRSLALITGHLALSEEEAACIVYHMGAYEKDMWDGYDAAIRKFPNVLYTHTADMLASKVDGV